MDIKEILVSVVVPVYNTADFLHKTVASILNQDHQKLEIILVDDGSTDGSGAIIDDFAKVDDRVICIHNGNHGVSYSRNVGIANAKGDYIVFVDGDDWTEKDHISYLLSLSVKNNSQVAFGTKHFTDNGNRVYNDKTATVYAYELISAIYLNKIYMAVWNRIYKKSFLLEHGILFDEDIWYAEGMLFNVRCLSFLDTVPIGTKRTYHYMTNPNSAMRYKFKLENELCAICSLKRQFELLDKRNKKVVKSHKYHLLCIYRNIVNGLIRTGEIKRERTEYKNRLKNIRKSIFFILSLNISVKEKLGWFRACFPRLNKIAKKIFRKK